MTRLEPAIIPDYEVDRAAKDLAKKWHQHHPTVRQLFRGLENSADVWQHMRGYVLHLREGAEVFRNDVYQVEKRECGKGLVHLSIKRIDRQPIHDWRDLQEIKNQLLGPECEALELYPAESRKVDGANQYHLWGFSNPETTIPIGWFGERVVTEESINGSVNRPFEKL